MTDEDDGQGASPGLPGELVRAVAERLREENSEIRQYGYQLALVPRGEAGGAGGGEPDRKGADGADGGGGGSAEGPRPLPLPDPTTAVGNGEHGHWSEVEIQKLPNNDLSIRLRGYAQSEGSEQEERMAELVRRLLRNAIF